MAISIITILWNIQLETVVQGTIPLHIDMPLSTSLSSSASVPTPLFSDHPSSDSESSHQKAFGVDDSFNASRRRALCKRYDLR